MPSSNTESGAALTSKVPQITPSFWVLKLLTTGMGEAASDYLLGADYMPSASAYAWSHSALALWVQFRTRAYRPFAYWSAVMMVAVFGTMAADMVHHQLGVPYMVSTLMGVVAVTLTFAVWRRVEGTLSGTSRRANCTSASSDRSCFSPSCSPFRRWRIGAFDSTALSRSGGHTSSPGHWAPQ
jgi:uncharacterized membrane-anchored protein